MAHHCYYTLLLCFCFSVIVLASPPSNNTGLTLTDYILRAHGTRRFSFVGDDNEWGYNTKYDWAPFSNAQCLLGGTQFGNPLLLRDDGTFFLELVCQNPNMSPYIIGVDANSGKLMVASSNDWFPPSASSAYLFASDLAYLPSGDIAFGGLISTDTSGVNVFDGISLKQKWTYSTCKGNQACGKGYAPREVTASATSDLLLYSAQPGQVVSQYIDVAVSKGLVGQLPNMTGGLGLDYTGSYLFSASQSGLFKSLLPIVSSTKYVPFALPSGISNIVQLLSDTKENVYLLVSYVGSFGLLSLSSDGSVRWTGQEMTSSFSAQSVSTIITDDESLIVYTQAANNGIMGQALWWSAAFSTSTGKLAWNITTSSWPKNGTAVITCGFDVVPLINSTILYQCSYAGSINPFIYLYPVNQNTGQRFPGEVWIFSKNEQYNPFNFQYDSGSNLYLCGEEGSYPSPSFLAWCMKRYLPSCLYQPHSLDCIYGP